MILADTSAWVEFFRRTGSRAHRALRDAIDRERVATTEVVIMEVLMGARDDEDDRELESILAGVPLLAVSGLDSWELAARIHRSCRLGGHTISSQLDCLIAAVAIREEVPVLHADRDFDVIAQHSPLRVVAV